MIYISHRRGFALVLALVFIVVACITSIAVYSYSLHIVRNVRIEKKAATRSYYYCVAGARYAQILLKDPVANFGFTDEAFNGETRTITRTGNTAGSLGADLGFNSSDTLTIKATEYDTGNPTSTPWQVNSYQIDVSFTH